MLREELNAALLRAVYEDDAQAVKRLLEERADPGAVDVCSSQTPLHWAVRRGCEATAQLLLEARGDPAAVTPSLASPLHLAAAANAANLVALLLKSRASATVQDSLGRTALHIAAESGCEAAAAVLCSDRALAMQNGRGEAPLASAAGRGHLAVVKLLLRKKADIQQQNRWNKGPLQLAEKAGHASVVEALLEASSAAGSADVKVNDENDYIAENDYSADSGADFICKAEDGNSQALEVESTSRASRESVIPAVGVEESAAAVAAAGPLSSRSAQSIVKPREVSLQAKTFRAQLQALGGPHGEICGKALAWCRYLDLQQHGEISFHTFCELLAGPPFEYHKDVNQLWHDLGVKGSSRLRLGDVDPETSHLLSAMCSWCSDRYGNPFALFAALVDATGSKDSHLTPGAFAKGLRSLGFFGDERGGAAVAKLSCEEELHLQLMPLFDASGKECIFPEDFIIIEADPRQQRLLRRRLRQAGQDGHSYRTALASQPRGRLDDQGPESMNDEMLHGDSKASSCRNDADKLLYGYLKNCKDWTKADKVPGASEAVVSAPRASRGSVREVRSRQLAALRLGCSPNLPELCAKKTPVQSFRLPSALSAVSAASQASPSTSDESLQVPLRQDPRKIYGQKQGQSLPPIGRMSHKPLVRVSLKFHAAGAAGPLRKVTSLPAIPARVEDFFRRGSEKNLCGFYGIQRT